MKEGEVVKKTSKPNTISSLTMDFQKLGIKSGDTILVHSSLSAIGWTSGNAIAVIEALIKTVGLTGNIIMPSFTSENSDPKNWQNPPVPEEWHSIIRKESPPFDPRKTPTRMMGVIAETFRSYPNVLRSNHPRDSFCALGPKANYIISSHQLTPALGLNSPLERNVKLNGKILLLGVDHGNNTTLHYADWCANYKNKKFEKHATAILIENNRKWVEFEDLEYEDDDFLDVGKCFEKNNDYQKLKIGIGIAKLYNARDLVNFAIKWFEKNR